MAAGLWAAACSARLGIAGGKEKDDVSDWRRQATLWLAARPVARTLVAGTVPGRRLALGYVAGEDLDDAVAVAKETLDTGADFSLDYLGPPVTTEAQARKTADAYLTALDEMILVGVGGSLSLKPAQLGRDLDPVLWRALAHEIAEHARRGAVTVTLDMDDASTADATLRTFAAVQAETGNMGVAIQARLYRSRVDLEQISRRSGGMVRLCKGAFREGPRDAYRSANAIRRNFVRLAEYLLRTPNLFPCFATSDVGLVDVVQDLADELGIDRETYEFQLLHGFHSDLAHRLVSEGHRVRVFIPYGPAWYEYLARRVAERPGLLGRLVSDLSRDLRGD